MNPSVVNIVSHNSPSCTPSSPQEFFTPAHCAYLEEKALKEKQQRYDYLFENVMESFDMVGQLNGRSLSLSSFENISNENSNFLTEYSVSKIKADPGEIGKVSAVIERERKRDPREKEWAYEKRRFALQQNIQEFIAYHGIHRVGFATFTFADCPPWKEASRRWNSFLTGHLNKQPWWGDWILVKEYQKRGSIHFHLIVAFPEDIRTGFDFDAVAKGDYRSASPFLRGIWADFRKVLPKYGFGRHEILPIKGPHPNKPLIPGTDEATRATKGIASYLGKYLVKSFRACSEYNDEEKQKPVKERREWHGRYISYSHGAKVWSSQFQFFKNGGMWWRRQVRTFASLMSRLCNVPCTWEGMQSVLGSCWVYNFGDIIKAMTENPIDNLAIIHAGMFHSCLSSSMHLVWRSGFESEWLRLFKYESPPVQQAPTQAQAA